MNKAKELQGRKHAAQYIYHRVSDDTKLHRCIFCWPDVDLIDNGFKPIEKKYPHYKDCPYKDKF